MNNAANTVNVPCPKCNGKGKLSGYGHIERGVCFMCNGKREFAYNEVPRSAKQILVSKIRWVFETVADVYEEGTPPAAWLDYWARDAAVLLFSLNDTAKARELLNESRIPSFRNLVIAVGREIKAGA